jgi:hypothetical protein
VWRFEQRTFDISSLSIKLILAGQEVPRGPQQPEQVALHSTQTLPPNMHHKWEETFDFVWKTTNWKS